MKTHIFVCSHCGAVQFHDRSVSTASSFRCGVMRAELVVGPEWTDPVPCPGTMEYYAYSDFDRFK